MTLSLSVMPFLNSIFAADSFPAFLNKYCKIKRFSSCNHWIHVKQGVTVNMFRCIFESFTFRASEKRLRFVSNSFFDSFTTEQTLNSC